MFKRELRDYQNNQLSSFMAEKIIFAVGSRNQIKIQAVRNAAKKFWPKAKVVGIKVSSRTSAQPETNWETQKGAFNRAEAALKKSPKADFGVGLESGIEFRKDGLWTFGWVVIVDQKGKTGVAKTVEFRLPPGLAELIKNGLEQGQADAQFFKRDNKGEKEGTVGLLTRGKVKRAEAFSQAIIFALVPFLNPEYY